jgi:hypothetical protein
MKTVSVVRAAARWIERLLEVRLRMDAVAGLAPVERDVDKVRTYG